MVSIANRRCVGDCPDQKNNGIKVQSEKLQRSQHACAHVRLMVERLRLVGSVSVVIQSAEHFCLFPTLLSSAGCSGSAQSSRLDDHVSERLRFLTLRLLNRR